MKRLAFLAAALSIAVGASALAQQPAAETPSTAGTTSGPAAASAVRITASVEGVDAANRTVTLKGPRARVVTLPVGPEVANFDELKAGDIVVVRYIEALSVELKKSGAGSREAQAGDAAKPDDRPPAGDVRLVTVVADVVGVDPKRQIVTLRGPKRTVDLKVRDPDQLKPVKVGDQVEASYTEARVISVEPVTRVPPPVRPAG